MNQFQNLLLHSPVLPAVRRGRMEECVLSELLDVRNIKTEGGALVTGGAPGDDEADGIVCADALAIMPHLDTDTALGMMEAPAEMLQPALAAFEAGGDEETMQSTDSAEDVVVQLMDIRTPLARLRGMLEQRLGISLQHFTFWLQDAKMLEAHKTLVDQCIKGEGVVQVNLQLNQQLRRINILDVLKPDEELVDLADGTVADDDPSQEHTTLDGLAEDPEPPLPSDAEPTDSQDTRHCTATKVKWVVDQNFKSDRARLKIPDDPRDWSVEHVKVWIQWAVRQFNLTGIKLADWSISGEQLYNITEQQFKEMCPNDPGHIFWTHLELLRRCKFITVIQKDDPTGKDMPPQHPPPAPPPPATAAVIKKKPRTLQHTNSQMHILSEAESCGEYSIGVASRNGSNGQIQLWQFLLELLTSADHLPFIQWHGTEGEFKLCNPELVARLWGARKHKPAMNYEKLSRALRYYYDGDMIAKVAGKRFVYKFVCDLRQLVGYDAGELARLVRETHEQQCAGARPAGEGEAEGAGEPDELWGDGLS